MTSEARQHAWSEPDRYVHAYVRDQTRRVERPPVRRPLGDRRDEPAPVAPDDRPDLAALVRSAVDGGAATLAEVTTQVLPLNPEAERHAGAGRVAPRKAYPATPAAQPRSSSRRSSATLGSAEVAPPVRPRVGRDVALLPVPPDAHRRTR